MKWFKHDSRANRDSKIEKVLIKYGAEGYALYWLCLELIADRIDKENISFELEHDAETLGHRLKIDSIKVEEIMRYFVEISLFENTNGIITCLKLADRLENSIVKNPQIEQIKKKIRENPGLSGTFRENPGQTRLDQIRLDKNRIDYKDTGERKKSGFSSLEENLPQSLSVKENKEKRTVFKIPCLGDVEAIYLDEFRAMFGDNHPKAKDIDWKIEQGGKIFDYYSANGWRVGKNTIKDLKAVVRNWIRRQEEFAVSRRK